MNNTNRGLNRLGILLFGLVLLAAGAGAAVAAAVPEWLEGWKSLSATVSDASSDVIDGTTLDGVEQSWILIAIAAACLVLIVLLVVFVFRQGHGRVRSLVTETPASAVDRPTGGSVVIDGRVAEQAIQHALDGHPGVVSSSVSTYLVGRTPALTVSVNVRRGVSPHEVRVFIDDTVTAWDAVLGREVPVLIQINAGLATRVAKPARTSIPAVE